VLRGVTCARVQVRIETRPTGTVHVDFTNGEPRLTGIAHAVGLGQNLIAWRPTSPREHSPSADAVWLRHAAPAEARSVFDALFRGALSTPAPPNPVRLCYLNRARTLRDRARTSTRHLTLAASSSSNELEAATLFAFQFRSQPDGVSWGVAARRSSHRSSWAVTAPGARRLRH